MKSGSKILGVTGTAVVLLLAARVGIGFLNQPTDEQLIQTAIKEAIAASKEGKAGGVLELMSSSLTVNQGDANGSKSNVSKYISNMRPDVTFANTKPTIEGDGARIETSANIKVNLLGNEQSADIPTVTIRLTKEEDKEWLIIPKRKWRITNVDVPLENIPGLLGGSFFGN
jgi:hypothetical protein